MSSSFKLLILALLAYVVSAQNYAPPQFNSTGFVLQANDSAFVYRSPLKSSSLVYRFSTNIVPHFRLSYFKANKTSFDAFSLAEFTWRAGILKLVEYNASVDVADSTSFVKFYGQDATWTPITLSNSTDPTTGALVQSASTTFTKGPTSVVLTATLVQTPLVIHKVALRPDAIKYSMNITGFPYTMTNSSLAIIKFHAEVAAGAKSDWGCMGDNSTICFGGGKGWFKWNTWGINENGTNCTITDEGKLRSLEKVVGAAEAVVIKGHQIDVGIVESWGFSVHYFNSNHSNLFFWDPQVGVNVAAIDSSVTATTVSTTTTSSSYKMAFSSSLFAASLLAILSATLFFFV